MCTFVERSEVARENGGVDVEKAFRAWEGDVKHTEQRHKARIHHIPPSSSLKHAQK